MDDENVSAQPRAFQAFNPNGPPLFSLGQVVATPTALTLLTKHGVTALTLLNRHRRADWGDLSAQDQSANNTALLNGGRLLSAYVIKGDRIWIITEAVGQDGVTRESTCVLLAKEY